MQDLARKLVTFSFFCFGFFPPHALQFFRICAICSRAINRMLAKEMKHKIVTVARLCSVFLPISDVHDEEIGLKNPQSIYFAITRIYGQVQHLKADMNGQR